MSYDVYFSDSTSIQPHSLTVVDKTINTQTSLTFVGRNYANYSQYIAENFLKLLENFSNSTAPTKAVQGQLWYDSKNHVLMVNSGSTGNWISASGVTKSITQPDSATTGDLWVDTFNKQLKIFNGFNWDLIGPQFAQGLFAGAKVEELYDDSDVKHNIISLYSDNHRVAIVSGTAFTPRSTIIGFSNVIPGINLINSEEGVVQTAHRFRGTATDSDRLGGYVATDYIRTNSTDQIPEMKVKTIIAGFDSGLSIGSNTATIPYSVSSTGNDIDIRIDNRSIAFFTATGNVGIRTQSPTSTLDVSGICTSVGLAVTGEDDVVVDLSGTQTASVQIGGGVSIGKSVLINNNLNVGDGTITVSKAVAVNGVKQVLMPMTTNEFDIGSAEKKFKTIYSSKVVADELSGKLIGSLVGSVNGSVTGTATKLETPSIFVVSGDIASNQIPFIGNGELVDLNTSLTKDFIDSKSLTNEAKSADLMLVYRANEEDVATFNGFLLNSTLVVTSIVSGEIAIGCTITGIDLSPGNEILSGTTIVSGPTVDIETGNQLWKISYPQTIGTSESPIAILARSNLFKETRKTFLQTVAVTGAITMFPSIAAVPTGYLVCDGAQHDISTYPELAELLQTTDPSFFNVPDLTASAPAGMKYIIFTGKL